MKSAKAGGFTDPRFSQIQMDRINSPEDFKMVNQVIEDIY